MRKIQEHKNTTSREKVENNVEAIYQVAKDYRDIYGQPVKFNKKDKKKLEMIVNLIDYENVLYKSRGELSKLLGIDDSGNLIRFFRNLDKKEYLRYVSRNNAYGEDIKPHYIKIYINPIYGWRDSERITKEEALKEYRLYQDLSEASKFDITLSQYFIEVDEFD
ncbi:hypothetical protein [Vreelandella arcis]|uniref:Uncharacterized protein n=1 Tax=Vreelandella arcis TaxID=416873 RepID=A0A1H0IZY9_9GAMM|nr:hypothetical protein [Halomonas arcis]SDO36780.1 hypothetical protein SAMN04487951_1232 [Halomonas arcis]